MCKIYVDCITYLIFINHQRDLDLWCLKRPSDLSLPFTKVEMQAQEGFEVQVCKMVIKM